MLLRVRGHGFGRRTGIAITSLVLMATGAACGSSASSSSSPTTLNPSMTSQLDEVIPQTLSKEHIPGAIVGIWSPSGNYVKAFGVSDTATRAGMQRDFHMRIGSNTKSFAVTAVLQLVDQKKVGLDDPINKYVPGVPNGDNITIRELAAMRSGLSDYSEAIVPNVLASQPQRVWSAQEILAMIDSHPVHFAPGTQFEYNNSNTYLVGLVVEKVSGQPLSTYLQQHILDPEGLTNTALPPGDQTAFPSPHPQGYTNYTPTGKSPPGPNQVITNATNWNPSWAWAAGAMYSTVDDLHTWTRDVATGKLLTPATQAQRLQFGLAPSEGQGVVYGLGLDNNNGWIGHNGSLPGFMSQPMYLPAQQMSMVILVNSDANVLGFVNLTQAITKIISPNNIWPNPPTE